MPQIIRKRLLSPDAVRAIREAKGITLRVAADTAGISSAHLSRIERGQRVPNLGTILAIAAALDVSIDAISYAGEDAA